ncbi:MAG: (2Fe-2S) ferredoxin domain-containing protein [Candidatus Izemoplasmatales bacterium]|nr:(2Fe-2S) ferredoxin domain-containing protein [Candidatus Izemoplasmatales bacterium]
MKSLEDLKKLREKSIQSMNMRYVENGVRVQVGMGTCGIAAGARAVLNKFLEEINAREITNITVTQVGCMGECAFEPIVEVVDANGDSSIYCLVDERKVPEIIEEHIVNGVRLDRYLLSGVKR